MLSKIHNIEEHYKANDYNGTSQLYKKRNFRGNVMLSAPHAVNQLRKGSIKYAEAYTGSMTEYLSDTHLICSITKTLNENDDANFDDTSKYRDEAVKLIKENGIKFLIDIHGASESRDFDIEIGTARGRNINYNDEIVDMFFTLAREYDYSKINVDELFTASNKNTVSSYVNEKTGIYSIQLEINKKYRSPDTEPEEFEKMLKFLSHFIVIIDNYLNSKKYLDVITISTGRGLNPFNKIELPNHYLEKHGLNVNEFVELINFKGESVCCKVVNSSDDNICVSLRYFEDYFKISDKASLFDAAYRDASILRPKVEVINNNKIFVTQDIYDIVKNKQMELINLRRNRRIIMDAELYPYLRSNKNGIYLNYYQRKLLGIEVPDVLSKEEFTDLNDCFMSDNNIDLTGGYYETDSINYKMSPDRTTEMFDKLSNYYRRSFCVVKWKSSFSSDEKLNIYDKLIGKQIIHLIAGRGYEKDDGNELVRMTANTIKLLGIEETDTVIIKHNDSEVRLRALSFESMDMEKIMRSNGINNCEDVEYLIGIPAKYRLKLGIHESGTTGVRVARDTKYLFVKNLNTQLLTIFGTIITITQLPIENAWIKGILAALSIPVVMNVVFSYERAKI